MKINKIQENMQKEIAALTEKLGEYREFLKHWQHKVIETEQKLAKLCSASAALDGNLDSTSATNPIYTHLFTEAEVKFLGPKVNIPLGGIKGISPSAMRPPDGTIDMLNGEPIVLEPGFMIGKNSLGEECIIPVGFEFPQMAEPLKPGPAATSIPQTDLPEASNNFDKPEDLL